MLQKKGLTIHAPLASGSVETLFSNLEPLQSTPITGAGTVYSSHVCHDRALVRSSNWIVAITRALRTVDTVVPLHTKLVTWVDFDDIFRSG